MQSDKPYPDDSDIQPEDILHNCNTCACIGGWTNAVLGMSLNCSSKDTGDMLGLTFTEANYLFYGCDVCLCDITQAHAVAMLDHIIAGGKVDWRRILGDSNAS